MEFSGVICSDRKALEIGELLSKNHGVYRRPKSWELAPKFMCLVINGLASLREGIKHKRGEGGVGFSVSEPLPDDVTIIEKLTVMKPYC